MNSFNSIVKSVTDKRQSWLCVGLDISPESLESNNFQALKEHTFKVIDATRDYAVAYKPNFAFFERWGSKGFTWLEETVNYIGNDHIKIADAKRGDIGNTAYQYSESIFNHFGFDCATINPYMGRDSIEPFLDKKEKGVFLLARTSNPSSTDLQDLKVDGITLFEKVVHMANDLNKNNNVGLVVGATAPMELRMIRDISQGMPFLIPGVGAQGGELSSSLSIGNQNGVGLINISRNISFAGDMTYESIKNASIAYLKQMREVLL